MGGLGRVELGGRLRAGLKGAGPGSGGRPGDAHSGKRKRRKKETGRQQGGEVPGKKAG